jgi:hypothetical protein
MSEEQSGPEVGQLWIARSDRGAELQVLVVEVRDEHVQALLCDEECDSATDTDAVLSPITTGLPRRVLVHGDVSASILTRRLSRPVGRIDPHVAQRIALRGRGSDFNSNDLGRGPAILSDSDPRWEWKLAKHRDMRALRARAGELGLEIYRLGSREG